MALVTVRVPEQVRKEMRKLRSVNWSALIRDAIESRIEMERLASTRDWDKVREGSRMADTICAEMARTYGQIDFNSAETIRYWRETKARNTSRTPP